MVSINTNSGALASLQALNANSRALEESQNRVSTGLKVSSAKDNSAVYQIAQNMRAQISSWNAVNANLDRAKGALDVTLTATSMVSDTLTELKTKAVSLQDTSLDTTSRSAIQNDILSLLNQINNIVSNSSFDGINLLKGDGNSIINIPTTSVSVSVFPPTVPFTGVNGSLSPAASSGVVKLDFNVTDATSYAVTLLANQSSPAVQYLDNNYQSIILPDGQYIPTHQNVNINKREILNGGFLLFVHPQATSYISPYYNNPTVSMNSAVFVPDYPSGNVSFMSSPNGDNITTNRFPMTSASLNLDNLDFTNPDSVARKISIASNFVSEKSAYYGTQSNAVDSTLAQNRKMVDSLTDGIGKLVDADMSKESANIQSLQTKQQLSVQSLSIANKSIDWIASLFK